MGLYDLAYMLAVPGMTVTTVPKDATEMLALLRTAVEYTAGPFAIRYPRDVAPDESPAIRDIAAAPYGTWEVLRHGSEFAILAVGTLVRPCLRVADQLATEGLNVTVVNCRFLKPYDEVTLRGILAEHTQVLIVEEGTVVNGFGAFMSSVIARHEPGVRVSTHGVPDTIVHAAPRASQLAAFGLDEHGIAEQVRALRETEAMAGGDSTGGRRAHRVTLGSPPPSER